MRYQTMDTNMVSIAFVVRLAEEMRALLLIDSLPQQSERYFLLLINGTMKIRIMANLLNNLLQYIILL